MDLVGPLPSSRGFTYLFSIVNRTSHWPWPFHCPGRLLRIVLGPWFPVGISRFGVPAKITSDRGAQFTSSIWGVLCSLGNISRSKTSSFHPQSNRLMESFHRSLKTPLQACLAGPDWFDHLPLVMLGLRTTPHDKTGFSDAKGVYSAPVCLPGEFLYSKDLVAREFLDRIQSALRDLTLPPPHHVAPSASWVSTALASAEFVFVCEDASIQPLSQLYRGPYSILCRQDKFFTLEIGSRTDTVSIDCLKPVLGPVLNSQQPPCYCRPPKACPHPGSPVLGSVPASGLVLEAVSAPVCWNPMWLVRRIRFTPPSISSTPRQPRR